MNGTTGNTNDSHTNDSHTKSSSKILPQLTNTCGPSAEGRRYVATRNMKTHPEANPKTNPEANPKTNPKANPEANPKAQSGSCTTPMQQREIRVSVTPTNCVLYYKWYNMSFVG